MKIDNALLVSDLSSLKVLAQGSGALSVTGIGGAGELASVATIPHGYGSDELLFQVSTDSAYVTGAILPWQSNDSRLMQYARLDNTNLYIIVIVQDSSGFGFPGFTMNYSYRILIP